mmetsp:Transcript_134449/g.287648  ORF Transcript_134449/g.287648 Transcript_134449/m.287648 type:complete len:110 (-) Transcript_134449:912-1241(-)
MSTAPIVWVISVMMRLHFQKACMDQIDHDSPMTSGWCSWTQTKAIFTAKARILMTAAAARVLKNHAICTTYDTRLLPKKGKVMCSSNLRPIKAGCATEKSFNAEKVDSK